VSDASKIEALVKLLPGWAAIWETGHDGPDRLVFLSPQLIARYKELLRFPDSHGRV
jgi:hypothetical protein